ncbi:MAG: cell division protein FtsA, partial [Syntrophomonadaceae bacterium]|nr:cell division protein FtsA [Syntrophomonadaceae bacterium]
GSVVAYGMVPIAGDELTEALIERCLVDFAWAEKIKRSIASNQFITYENVLGLEEVIDSQEAMAVITPALEKLPDEIASTIQTLNGGQSPSAVFCVGGGAQTPGLPEKLANKLGLPVERVAIRGRQAIANLVVDQATINGPEGVTVVGIASVAIKKFGHDFITISVNGREFKLFNSEKLDVANALALVGYNSRQLIGRNGRNLEFKLNGWREIDFGEIMKPAKIFVNDQPASLQTPIHNGDKITVISAVDGQDAEATVKDFLHNYPGISVVHQDQVRTLEPRCFLNGIPASYDDRISSGDQLDIYYISKIEDFFKEEGLDLTDYKVLVNNIPVNKDYILRDGDRVEVVLKNSHHDSVLSENRLKEVSTGIKILVNDDEIYLEGNREHIFVEVFSHIDFDLNRPRGMINLQLNGRAASFTDVLRDGDRVLISWSKKE